LVAPYILHDRTIDLIEKETGAAKAGKNARIIIKINSLIDQPVIDSLYRASQLGVKIDLIVRGICGLVPGVKGLSENIKVRSILGRFLEHSRVFYFHNADNENKLYIGSADWMQRNFLRRVEAVFPIEDPELIESVLSDLELMLSDNQSANVLKSDGNYSKINTSVRSKKYISCQQALLEKSELKTNYLIQRNSVATSRKTNN
jgi:polyphosphate kinase